MPGSIPKRAMQTLDLEFTEWCHELLRDGMDPVDFLRVLSQCGFVWDACRARCARLCVQRGFVGMARDIMTNEDGTIPNGWHK